MFDINKTLCQTCHLAKVINRSENNIQMTQNNVFNIKQPLL